MKNDKNIRKGITAILIAIMMLIVVFTTTTITANADDSYTIMHPDAETIAEWIGSYNAAPDISIEGFIPAFAPRSHSVLDHVDYVPGDRNQGSCGNCWAWAGTGCMEVTHDVEYGVFDRLSIQYLNSLYSGGTGTGYACCGGWLADLADFYITPTTLAVPWSNTNANWQDAGTGCGGSTTVPAGIISTTPHYGITSIDELRITTQTVDQDIAIANIKSVLNSDNAVWFGFFLPNGASWGDFFDFWDYDSETDVWNFDPYCETSWNSETGGGHAVLCVGYDDTDPDNSYWIMLNSWGTRAQRPTGLLRVDMDINYGCQLPGLNAESGSYSLYWQKLSVEFDNYQPEADAGDDETFEQTYYQGADVPLNGSGSSDPDGDPLTYSWTWPPSGSATGVSPTVSLPLGETIITLVVNDGAVDSDPDTVRITVEDTTPPVITCPTDLTVEQATPDGTVVPLTATATDICDADVEITSDELEIYPLGATIVTFTATDDSGNSATCTTTVTVEDTTPPVITCPDNVTVEQETADGTEVSLTATATDICDADPTITNDTLAIYPLGMTTVTFNATDDSGNSASCSMTVTVVDTTAPDISVTVSPDTLWPPNHKMVDITAIVTVSDICDADPSVVLNVTSDEPDNAIGDGDGNTINDIQGAEIGTEDYEFQLRAERAGTGDGRVYTITYTATDASGNSASAYATVVVPHDMD